jgi:hypothetical protein
MSLPGSYDFELYEGDSNKKGFQFLEEDRTPVNLTGSTIILTAKRHIHDIDPVVTLHAVFDNAENGDFHLVVLPSDTKNLGTAGVPLILFYDMQYTHLDTVITITFGKLTILPEITR